MNPTPTTTTETHFAWESFLPLWGIGVAGVLLLATCWWLARRDGRLADRRWAVAVLATLRTVSILVLLWMLAGPTWVTVRRKFRPKSVAVLVDRSASMGLADGVDGSGNVTRWAAARAGGGGSAALRGLDEALAVLRVAQGQLERFGRLPESNGDATTARAELGRVVRGLERAIAEGRPRTRDSGEEAASLEEAWAELSEGPVKALRLRLAEFERGRTLSALDRGAWLPDVLAGLAQALGRLEGGVERAWRRRESDGSGAEAVGFAEELGRSRWDKVESLLQRGEGAWLGALRRTVHLPRYEFGDKVVPLGTAPWVEPKAEGEGEGEGARRQAKASASTHLGAALQQLVLDRGGGSLAAAVLLTDGGHNAGRDPREVAPGLAGTPLIVVPIGNTRMQRDVILHHAHAPKAVLRNDQVVLDGVVTAYDCSGETLRVELVDNGAVVDQRTVEVRGEVHDARFQLRWKAAEAGRRKLELRVVPVEKERTEANNVASAEVLVMEDRLRVLVADHFPRWETRYLLNLFRRDERITFDRILFEPVQAAGKGVLTAFPGTLAEWSKYRVVILGDVWPAHFSREQQRQLIRYVTEAGGNVILVAGKDAMPAAYLDQPLGSLLPVETGPGARPGGAPHYLHLADEGAASVATQIGETPEASERLWREMSERLPIHGLSDFSRAKRTAHTLIWASRQRKGFSAGDPATRSFVSWHYVGSGRVVHVAAPVTYQLRYREGDTHHHRFWGQLLRWAVARDLGEGSRTVRLSTDKSRYEQGEVVEASVRLSRLDGVEVGGAALSLTAFQEGRAVQEVGLKEDPARPGTYRGSLPGLAVGPVRLEATGESVKALLAEEGQRRSAETTVSMDPSGELELRHPLCQLALLRETADAAGGMLVPPTGLAAALAQLDLEPEVREETAKSPLWNRWDLFWLFILCLSLEWAGRKWVGLS